MVEPGRRCLGDRYELHQLIASGGMGQVWRGRDTALHRPVAVKVLRSEYTGDPSFLARFRAEARHAASLGHPNIAAVFDYGEETAGDGSGETLAYLVMELVEGEPLSRLLARQGGLDTGTTLSVLRQTAAGLAEAHRAGLVHRDVKPGNILVGSDGTAKITDFGIAWSARSVALTRTGQVIGTPQYLSPEQAEGRLATPASDVYALGLIGYECLAGRPAFAGDNAVTIALKQLREQPEPLSTELPAQVRSLVDRALDKDPSRRLPDGAAFVAAIEDVLSGRALAGPPPTVMGAAVPADRQARKDGVRPASPARGSRRPPVARPPTAPRRGRVATVVLPLVGLLAGAGIAVAVLEQRSDPVPTASVQQQETPGVVLDAANYVGRPVDEVATQLAAFGLTVRRSADPDAVAPPGTVTGLSPAGAELFPGDTVRVRFAAARGPGVDDGGGGAVTEAVVGRPEPSTDPAPSDDTAPPTTGEGTTPNPLPGSSSAPTGSTGSTPTTDVPGSTGATSGSATTSSTASPTTPGSGSATTTAGGSAPRDPAI